MNKQHKVVKQECDCCGCEFSVTYWDDGTYTYMGDPCDCVSDFHPVAGSPSIYEWLESTKQ